MVALLSAYTNIAFEVDTRIDHHHKRQQYRLRAPSLPHVLPFGKRFKSGSILMNDIEFAKDVVELVGRRNPMRQVPDGDQLVKRWDFHRVRLGETP